MLWKTNDCETCVYKSLCMVTWVYFLLVEASTVNLTCKQGTLWGFIFQGFRKKHILWNIFNTVSVPNAVSAGTEDSCVFCAEQDSCCLPAGVILLLSLQPPIFGKWSSALNPKSLFLFYLLVLRICLSCIC